MARVVISGGEGFIGRHLAAALAARGDEVIVLARPGGARRPPPSSARLVRLDLAERGALDALFAAHEIDVIYHLAANARRTPVADLSDWTGSVREDLLPLVTLVAAAATARRPPRVLVRAGSIAEYGDAPVPYAEDGPALPRSAYGAALLAGTAYLRSMAPILPFRVSTARLALTYGPGQSTEFFAAKLMANLPRGLPVVVNRPEDRRSLVHVDDVVEALALLADRPLPLVNVATDDAPSMRELADLVAELTGADPALLRFDAMSDPPVTLRADTALARTRLGWSARHDLRTGIMRSLAHARASGLVPQ